MKEKPQRLQDELLASEWHRAAAEARYDVLQRSKALPLEAPHLQVLHPL